MESVSTIKGNEIALEGWKLNVYVLLLTPVLWILVSGPYIYWQGSSAYVLGILKVLDIKIFVLLFLGIPIHELLHAIAWMLLKREGFQNIKFGFNWQALTPYTHYTKPLKVSHYRWGGALPGLIMGVFPVILSYFLDNASLNFVGFLFCWAALGDALSLFISRKLKSTSWVTDHPDKLGVIIPLEKLE